MSCEEIDLNFVAVYVCMYMCPGAGNEDRFRFDPVNKFVYICEINQSHYVI